MEKIKIPTMVFNMLDSSGNMLSPFVKKFEDLCMFVIKTTQVILQLRFETKHHNDISVPPALSMNTGQSDKA